jgi:ribosome maturation factor RimP
MLLPQPDDPVFKTLQTALKPMGLALVDVAVRSKNGTTKASVTVFDVNGLSIESCAQAHRMLVPLLENQLQTEDLYVEVGSPGLERNLKYSFELELFKSRPVKLLVEGASEWLEGILEKVDSSRLELRTGEEMKIISLADLLKARLNDL